MKTILVMMAAFFLSTNLLAQDPNFHIYICFGQSNMEGQGLIEAKDRIADSRFKVFQALNCPNLGRTKATWYTAVAPSCQCYSKLSPADYFGKTMIANLPDSITIGIINVAVAGCDIRLFDKDIYMNYVATYNESWFTDRVKAYEGNPYQYLLDLTKLAQKDGVIKGILLHQGETNTGQSLWPSYVKKIYNDMLTDLSLTADSVPILAGEVVSAPGNCCASMNTIIRRLPDTIPTAHVISSAGCPAMDNAHFNSEGYRILGRRYAVKMLSLLGYEAVYAEAECGTVGENWKVLPNIKTSNAAYVAGAAGVNNITSAPLNTSDIIQLDITVSSDTLHHLYGHFNNSGNGSSIWIKVDDGDFKLYENLTTQDWEWKELDEFELTAGAHKIYIGIAQENVMLDKVCLKNSHSLPVSLGEESGNICKPDFANPTDYIDTTGYGLYQNYPNPVINNSTIITFKIPFANYISLKVYDSNGLEIDELAGKLFGAGEHNITYNTDKLSQGTYFYSLQSDQFTSTRKMILHKTN